MILILIKIHVINKQVPFRIFVLMAVNAVVSHILMLHATSIHGTFLMSHKL